MNTHRPDVGVVPETLQDDTTPENFIIKISSYTSEMCRDRLGQDVGVLASVNLYTPNL